MQPVPFVFFVFLCVFPLDSDRRVVLIRFYGSEQSAQLMVLEGVILSERGKEAKQMDETKIRVTEAAHSKKIWMRCRSRERMVDEWN